MKNLQKGSTTTVLIIVIGLLIIAFGTYVYFNNYVPSSPVAFVPQNSIRQSSEITTTSAAQLDSNESKTYTNVAAGFSIDYSPDKILDAPRTDSNLSSIADVGFDDSSSTPQNERAHWAVSVYQKNTLTLDAMVKTRTIKGVKGITSQVSSVSLDGIQATKVDTTSTSGGSRSDIIFGNSKYNYDISAQGAGYKSPLFSKFYSSFKSL